MKILISNRGECALRIVRAAKQLGFSTVGVYAVGDEHQLHLRDVDESVCIGNAPSKESYLAIDRILTAAAITQATAIHPGYGFLSENATFAAAVENAHLVWIGPPASSMKELADKSIGRMLASHHGLNVSTGSPPLRDPDALKQYADTIGYPVLLKAANGGGGKGLRVVTDAGAWNDAYSICLQETQRAYNTDVFLLESYLKEPKHIEVQVLVSTDGIVHILGYRDCSLQYKHQKIIEESFFPAHHGINTRILEKNISSMLCSIGYRGLGTMEFLYTQGVWYFIEMNMRMQVEHPVTECQIGYDLIALQIQTACNKPLSLPTPSAYHAIECRINLMSFTQGARITELRLPGGCQVRTDTALYAGYTIPHHYDAMLAKIITYDHDRPSAIKRMYNALSEMVVEGVDHNIAQLKELLHDPLFIHLEHHTQML